MEEVKMDNNPEDESLLDRSPEPRRTKGGLKTMPFILGMHGNVVWLCILSYWTEVLISLSHSLYLSPSWSVNEAFERLASQGLMPNMILYLTKVYHFETATASTILFIWAALSDGLALFGAFLADSYFGGFRVIALGSMSSLLVSLFYLLCNLTYCFLFLFPT